MKKTMNDAEFQMWISIFQHSMANFISEDRHITPEKRASRAIEEADAAIEALRKRLEPPAKSDIIVPKFNPPKDIKK